MTDADKLKQAETLLRQARNLTVAVLLDAKSEKIAPRSRLVALDREITVWLDGLKPPVKRLPKGTTVPDAALIKGGLGVIR